MKLYSQVFNKSQERPYYDKQFNERDKCTQVLFLFEKKN